MGVTPEPFLTETVQADAEGNYRVDTLAPEPIELFAEHPSFARGSIVVSPAHSRTTRAEIVVTDGGGFEGHVYSAGRPFKNAYIQYGNADDLAMTTKIQTDDNGFYRMAHVPPGPVKTRISKPWRPGDEPMIFSERQLTIEEGRVQTVDVHFPAMTARVKGAVTINGVPAPSVNSRYRSLNGDFIVVDSMRPPQEDEYDTGPIPPREAEITVSVYFEGQSLSHVLHVTLEEGETSRHDVHFVGTAGISGAVNGNVVIFLYEGSCQPSQDTPPVASAAPQEGRYLLKNLPAGTYTLYAGEHPVNAENGLVEVVTLGEGEQKTIDLDTSAFSD